jgi:hypothetical protein
MAPREALGQVFDQELLGASQPIEPGDLLHFRVELFPVAGVVIGHGQQDPGQQEARAHL